MRITRVDLAHYRSSRHITVELDPNLNVFVGINGAGKTTILDAAALMLSWMLARVNSASEAGYSIAEKDILNHKSYAHLTMNCMLRGHVGENEMEWRIVQARRGRNAREAMENAPLLESELTVLDTWAELVRDDIGKMDTAMAHPLFEKTQPLSYSLPVIAYYPVNRVVREIPLEIRQSHRFELLEAYDGALTAGANFRAFFQWYRCREDLENERRGETGPFKPDRQLEAVREAITAFLPEVSGISVKRDPLRMEVVKDGEILRLDQMSDGEKCLFAMIGDLARRLAIANPVAESPLTGTGVVLIDEIDLHLHPQWQRQVIPNLRMTFPNCQFLVTTHSPQVITHVKPEDYLFLLTQGTDGLECHKVSEFYGKTADRVLEDLMGLQTTRPKEIAARLSDIYVSISENRVAEAKAEISSLRQAIGEDSELVKADVLIKRMEIIGK